jgi:hypothetical protein
VVVVVVVVVVVSCVFYSQLPAPDPEPDGQQLPSNQYLALLLLPQNTATHKHTNTQTITESKQTRPSLDDHQTFVRLHCRHACARNPSYLLARRASFLLDNSPCFAHLDDQCMRNTCHHYHALSRRENL